MQVTDSLVPLVDWTFETGTQCLNYHLQCGVDILAIIIHHTESSVILKSSYLVELKVHHFAFVFQLRSSTSALLHFGLRVGICN
jgi:hypothetical protein